MAGFTTIDTCIDRIKAVLGQYLSTELTLIDTRNNTLAGAGTDNNFTTPTTAAADIQTYLDRNKAKSPRMVITDEGRTSYADDSTILDNEDAADSTLPRVDRRFRVGVSVRVASSSGSDTKDGARRRCNRIADAVMSTLYKYPQLGIPATSTATLPCRVYLVDDGRAQEVTEDAAQFYARDLIYEIRFIEARA